MPRTRSIAWSQLKVGIIGVVAFALTSFLIFQVGGEGGFWQSRYPLKARFTDIAGLKAGAVVRLNGKEVGTVTSVEFAGTQLEAVFELLEAVRPLVTTEATAAVGSLSLLGEPIIDLKGRPGGRPLNDWEYVKASASAASMADLTSTASASLEQLNQLLADARAGRGTLGKLVADDALYNEMQAFVTSAGDLTRTLNSGRGTLGALLKDPSVHDTLRASLANVQTMTARINSGQGALGRFLNDEAMGRSMSAASSNVEQITGRLTRGEGTAGKLLTDQQLYDRLNSMAGRVDEVVNGLNAGRGTAGQLLQDRALYENMNRAVTELRDLLGEIKKDPRKYLRVNVSIF
ncbi:MAG: MCE family protein [Acidobacteria bacterium]|nr:MCE family protein [Acidobacteriota bacterium]